MRPREKTAAECADVARPRSNPVLLAALRAADAKAGVRGTQTEESWQDQLRANAKTLVNYATAPLGAAKYDASTLGR